MKIIDNVTILSFVKNSFYGNSKLPLYKSALVLTKFFNVDELFITKPEQDLSYNGYREAKSLFIDVLWKKRIHLVKSCKALFVENKLFLPPVVEEYNDLPVIIEGHYMFYWAVEDLNIDRLPCVTIIPSSYVPKHFYYTPIKAPRNVLKFLSHDFAIDIYGDFRKIELEVK